MSKPTVAEAAVPLPPASIDFNKLNDDLRAGKTGEEALSNAIHPDDRDYALPKPSEEAVNGSDDGDAATTGTSATKTSPDAP